MFVRRAQSTEVLLSSRRLYRLELAQLCRFYNSLIKLSIVDPASDADSAEMAHFTLRNSRFEEANSLYRIIAMGKF